MDREAIKKAIDEAVDRMDDEDAYEAIETMERMVTARLREAVKNAKGKIVLEGVPGAGIKVHSEDSRTFAEMQLFIYTLIAAVADMDGMTFAECYEMVGITAEFIETIHE